MTRIEGSFMEWWQANGKLFDAFLFDIDGTLISGKHRLAGAEELVEQMRRDGHPFYLLTNDGNHSTLEKSRILAAAGLVIAPDEIISCGMALRAYAERHGQAGNLFYVLGALGQPDFAELAGLRVCRDPARIGACDGVIIGEGDYDWQPHITAAFNFLAASPEKPLIVPNPDSYWPSGRNGEMGIGAGGVARFLCTVLADRGLAVEPVYLGKPSKAVFDLAVEMLCQRYGLPRAIDRRRILMLGDSLHADIQGAIDSGLSSCLMLSGITKMRHVAHLRPGRQPDYVCEGLSLGT
jgi:HAD superfamily hydrolase (TIGR01450 family)